jgi:hypothetical protein
MPKRCALLFAAAGYLLVIWYYSVAFAPLTWFPARNLLWQVCLSCVNVSGIHSAILGRAFFSAGPINAVIYAAVGFALAKLVSALGAHKTHDAQR